MRNGPSDYGRKAGGWWLQHGIAEVEPDGFGGMRSAFVRRDEQGNIRNQVIPRQSDLLVVNWGVVADHIQRYPDPGDPDVPEGSLLWLSVMSEIVEGTVTARRMNALARQIDALHDERDAEGYGA
jgi:hypothetical protein